MRPVHATKGEPHSKLYTHIYFALSLVLFSIHILKHRLVYETNQHKNEWYIRNLTLPPWCPRTLRFT